MLKHFKPKVLLKKVKRFEELEKKAYRKYMTIKHPEVKTITLTEYLSTDEAIEFLKLNEEVGLL